MNAPETFTKLLAQTREPFPASRKVYTSGVMHPQLRVPMREVQLSNGEAVTLYDTSGPYTDPACDLDVRRGLPGLRGEWIAARGDVETYAGRQRRAVDDGERSGADASERMEALRAQADGLQRPPRRAGLRQPSLLQIL